MRKDLNTEEAEDAEDTEGLVFKLKREIRLSRILSTEQTEDSEVIGGVYLKGAKLKNLLIFTSNYIRVIALF